MLDLIEERKKIMKKMKPYNYTLGRSTYVEIYDPRYPIKKKKFKDTIYYFFKCKVITRDNEKQPIGNHTIQLPSKSVVVPLTDRLTELRLIDESTILCTIVRLSNKKYDLTIHTK